MPVRKLIGCTLLRGQARYCPVCEGRFRTFLPCGRAMRPDAMCLVCLSRERHRLVWTFFKQHTNLFAPAGPGRRRRMLHVAPERAFARILEQEDHLDYLTADLNAPGVMVKMDVTDIQYPDDHFDVIYCSHVLEHVPEDRRAMRELRRVLSPGGWAVLQVPITAEETFEDPSVTDPGERERLFGQHDHVRRYGPDYADRLREAGFEVQKVGAAEVVGAGNVERMRVHASEEIHYCT